MGLALKIQEQARKKTGLRGDKMTEAAQRRDSRSRTEPFILAARAHSQGARDWSFSGIAARMNRLYDQLNDEFFAGKLPKALISIGPDLATRKGYYHAGRDGIGARHKIHLNSRHFWRTESDVGVALLHEMIHCHQYLFGRVGHRQRYHNHQFAEIAASIGFQVRVGNGSTIKISERLRRKLDQFGFSNFEVMSPNAKVLAARKPLRKVMWKCMCGQEAWIQKGDYLDAICKICHSPFERPVELTDSQEEMDLAVAEAAAA
jgi:hypothetical protein